jgi:hypothetical protein
MRKHLLWIAPWLVLWLSACATTPTPRPDLRSDVAKACAEWRWIGIKSNPEAACPDIKGWTGSPLFSVKAVEARRADYLTADPGKQETPQPDPVFKERRELNRFCVYEPEPGRKKGGDLPVLSASATPGLVRIDQDCAALSYTGDEIAAIAAKDWQPLSEHFLAQAGRPAAPLLIKNRQGVRLAFVDTQPDHVGVPPSPGNSEHGYTLAHIARHLVCSPADSDDCAAQITTRLALSITQFDGRDPEGTETDTTRGGYIGTQRDLARAIQSEVDDWQTHLQTKGWPEHLVLNLSLAWDGQLFGGLDENQVAELRAGAQAVYRALRYAAGFDALVLAAAGNARDCPGQTEGPLLPAAWETGAPQEESCSAGTAPLLYAVGGVDSGGRLLINARPGAMPRRAAHGENGIVADWEPGRSTMMYTGSSVATAVASSIAAIVWDTVPTLNSRGVMDLLDRAPVEEEEILPLRADFWFGARNANAAVSAPPVRRLSLCSALERACAHEEAVNCPLQSKCEPLPYEQAKPPEAVADIDLRSRLRSCHPWLVPQPEADPCPVCKPPRE